MNIYDVLFSINCVGATWTKKNEKKQICTHTHFIIFQSTDSMMMMMMMLNIDEDNLISTENLVIFNWIIVVFKLKVFYAERILSTT